MNLPVQIAFLTGQSDPPRCALSPVQEAFLDRLPVPPAGRVRRNFPYTLETMRYRPAPLLSASWHNARQYLASRRPSFAERHAPAVAQMLARADRTVLLAGSCGLELLANLSLPASVLRRTHVFAYGAVARHRPLCDLVVVRGGRDWIARIGGGRVDHIVEANHLDYLTSAAVLALCHDFVLRVSAESAPAVS